MSKNRHEMKTHDDVLWQIVEEQAKLPDKWDYELFIKNEMTYKLYDKGLMFTLTHDKQTTVYYFS